MNEQEPLAPDFIPQKCRDCPLIESGVTAWRNINELQDGIISFSINKSFEEKTATIPDGIVQFLGHIAGQDLSPSITNDREQAVRLFEQKADIAYNDFNSLVDFIESELKRSTSNCAGMQKVRVPRKDGSKILMRYCPVEADRLPADHEHMVPTLMRREE